MMAATINLKYCDMLFVIDIIEKYYTKSNREIELLCAKMFNSNCNDTIQEQGIAQKIRYKTGTVIFFQKLLKNLKSLRHSSCTWHLAREKSTPQMAKLRPKAFFVKKKKKKAEEFHEAFVASITT